MKRIIAFLPLIILAFNLYAQQTYFDRDRLDKITDSITNEGKTLYKSEWASWYGTDVFTAKCAQLRPQSGGYLSYDNGKNLVNIFFTKSDEPKVMATITFDYGFNKDAYKLDTTRRKLNKQEMDLYTIRQAAMTDIHTDTIYKVYIRTSLNPVPIIDGKTKRVYVLTGPENSGVVVFGNDYLIDFDKNNHILGRRRLHKNMISLSIIPTKQISLAGAHTHLPLTGEFTTATDICTLMLYEKFTTWKIHLVIGTNYTSVWDCKQDKLSILTMDNWKKISANQDSLKKLIGN